ncbi:related to TVP15 Tlg2-Vesicle Protein [Cephalotrichum gorgonifer]|uniref:Related to TVP15 Tlg2-Vesicle Protein n=1 Tax=Cephalotrichum gorgonifer TaxID=2041049 RepID=A0AAE8STC7_9PEZI|nr:related to TVP15 Tlg2-Vesicle Protein [Cephalotrichum gorgonifer]
MLTGGISCFFPISWSGYDPTASPSPSEPQAIEAVYIIIFAAAVALLEFQIPPQVSRYASFLFSFIGRGLFYIFIGSLILGESTWFIITGSVVGIIGVAYVVLEFVPSVEPPANMREADAGWGAEGV